MILKLKFLSRIPVGCLWQLSSSWVYFILSLKYFYLMDYLLLIEYLWLLFIFCWSDYLYWCTQPKSYSCMWLFLCMAVRKLDNSQYLYLGNCNALLIGAEIVVSNLILEFSTFWVPFETYKFCFLILYFSYKLDKWENAGIYAFIWFSFQNTYAQLKQASFVRIC